MRVAVLGAGYAGLTAARRLESALPDDADLVVVDDTGSHLVQHELHRLVRRPDLADELVVPLSRVLDRTAVRKARVESVDPEAGVATLADVAADSGGETDDGAETDDGEGAGDGGEIDGDATTDTDSRTLDYDYAVVALGAQTAFHGLPGVEEHGTPLKRVAHAERIRADFLEVLAAEAGGTVVVGGAGLSGVQVAGELATLAREEGHAVGPDADVTVRVLEQLDSVAPTFPAAFGEAIHGALEDRGVAVQTGATVERADADGVALADGERVGCDQLVWTGGIRGPDALGGERPAVRATLRLAGDGTFVVGDAARAVDADGEAVPASAQSALAGGRVAARNVAALVAHDREGGVFEPSLDRLDFTPRGWLVSVGDGAVGIVGSRVVTGAAARALKATVGAGYLTSVGAVRNAVDVVESELGYDGNRE